MDVNTIGLILITASISGLLTHFVKALSEPKHVKELKVRVLAVEKRQTGTDTTLLLLANKAGVDPKDIGLLK